MEILFSVIGTGLCPGCSYLYTCDIRKNLAKAAAPIRDSGGYGMEMVIYDCPKYSPAIPPLQPPYSDS